MSALLLDERTPSARREYRCEWCVDPIAKGERHHVQIVTEDGTAWSFRTHTECAALIQTLWREGRGDEEFGVCPDYGGHQRGQRCRECGDEAAAS